MQEQGSACENTMGCASEESRQTAAASEINVQNDLLESSQWLMDLARKTKDVNLYDQAEGIFWTIRMQGKGITEKMDSIEGLSFIKDTPEGRKFWAVESTGDYDRDFMFGKNLGRQTLRVMQRNHAGYLLPRIVKDMPSGDKMTGMEAGFLRYISEAAVHTIVQDSIIDGMIARD